MNKVTPKNMPNRFDENIRQLFSLIPIIHANQGIRLTDLLIKSNHPNQAALLRDLGRLMLIGTAPFGPSDFISISIETDCVYLDFPQGLDRPLDLSATEWLVLRKIIQAKINFQKSGSDNSDQLAQVLQKVSSIPVSISDADQNKLKRNLIKESLLDESQVEFSYKSLASSETELRRIDPWAVFQNKDSTYLIGYCYTRHAMRIFSLLRMADIGLLDEAITHNCPDNVNELVKQTSIFTQSKNGLTVKMALAPSLKHMAEQLFNVLTITANASLNDVPYTNIPPNWWIVTIKTSSQIWLIEILLGLGPNIIILEPDFLREKFLLEVNTRPIPGRTR